MFDKELFRKVVFGDICYITFKVGSLTGKTIYVGGKCFKYNFDETNDKEMELIARVLLAFYDEMVDKLKSDEEEDKLKEFDTIIKILNKYAN